MNESDTKPRHPIRVVAQRTGLTPATLRAWERRYGAVDPGRSDAGQRLYSDRDLERLTVLRTLTEAGRPISMVAALSAQEATDLMLEDPLTGKPRYGARARLTEALYADWIARNTDETPPPVPTLQQLREQSNA